MTSESIGDYYLGLDIGTSSVGWAVTDADYNILEYRRKALWGVHLFKEGQTAADRRMHRGHRRRLDRRQQRIALLRELFSHEIFKVDPSFFERLDDSGLHIEDRRDRQPNSLFNDPGFDDREFHRRFPTIYHLRRHLMETDECPDIRLVYLAAHHIVKHRGHFLFGGIGSEELPDLGEVLGMLADDVSKYDMTLQTSNLDAVSGMMTDRSLGVSDKKRALVDSLGCGSKAEKALAGLLAGESVSLSDLFSDDGVEDKVSFKDGSVDERLEELADAINPDYVFTLRIAKSVYDWSVLNSILKGHPSISDAMIARYEQHRHDLSMLKKAVRKYAPDSYGDLFKRGDIAGNYCSYSGVCGNGKPKKGCDAEAFCKYCRGILSDTGISDDPEFQNMLARLADGTFMPKQSTYENTVFPYTVHMKELKAILDNCSRFHPFLSVAGEDGLTPAKKIMIIQEFRIPYYVGPLDTRSPSAWVVRRSFENITPWNFGDVVDEEASAEAFMDGRTGMCTYMAGEKVLPKNSIVYCYFQLYNELNNLRVNGDRLPVQLKKRMVEDLFEDPSSKGRITVSKLQRYLVSIGETTTDDLPEITGINVDVKASLGPLHSISAIIGDRADNLKLYEDIVRIITVFANEKQIRRKLKAEHGDILTEDDIKRLSKLQLEGWGKLSQKFLTGIRAMCPELGREASIMDILENTQHNLMETIYAFGFDRIVDDHNASMTSDNEVTYETVDRMYASPAVKKSIWRALCVVNDVVDRIGHKPKKVFVETNRQTLGPREKGRTPSRKDDLLCLYRTCNEDTEWISDLERRTDADLRSRSLYLYYTQLGRCMYCGRRIGITELGNTDSVDRDHIHPRSVVKDDSIHNNMVLTCRVCNVSKSNRYPLPPEWQQKMMPMWRELRDKRYINAEKYSRLVRTEPFSDDEKVRFIDRQLVETSQSVKGTIEALKRLFGDDTEIVYVKAGAVSDFRQFCDSPVMVKSRSVNDLHHAKDAYLSIVVGNVHDTKFTKNFRRFIGTHEAYNLAKMYERPVSRNGVNAWIPGEDGTKATVLKYMRRNNILFTRQSYIRKGALFDDNPLKAKDTLMSRKERMDPAKYGGYDNVSGACYSLVEYEMKGKRIRSIESLPIHKLGLLSSGGLEEYYSERLQAEAKVIMPIIRIDSLFEIDGIRMHIGGRMGYRIVFVHSMQLLLPDEHHRYLKSISRYIEDRRDGIFRDSEYYGIDSSRNLTLFDFLTAKCDSKPYTDILANLKRNLILARDAFVNMDELEQADLLNEVLHSFQCNPVYTNLKKAGGVGLTGRILVNKKIGSEREVYLINQSPSGLAENRVKIS